MSWLDAESFCKTASQFAGQELRLPTEAQWEYACRAGSTTVYWNGDEEEGLRRIGWFDGNSDDETHPVGELAANAWGLQDCHGNVWEWCGDWYDETAYTRGDCTDPVGPQAGSERVIRGGSWSIYARFVRAARRFTGSPGNRYSDLGFRCLSSGRSQEKGV